MENADVLAHAVCTFDSGETRRLLASDYSCEKIVVVTMRPPPLGASVLVSLENGEQTEPFLVAETVVEETSYDPKDAMKCGFVAAVTELRGNRVQTESLLDVDDNDTNNQKRAERRSAARVRTKLEVLVSWPGKKLAGQMLNLSLTGALVSFGRNSLPDEVEVGVLAHLRIVDRLCSPAPAVKVEFVRLIGMGTASSAGVRFIDVDETTLFHLESIMLETLRRHAAEGDLERCSSV